MTTTQNWTVPTEAQATRRAKNSEYQAKSTKADLKRLATAYSDWVQKDKEKAHFAMFMVLSHYGLKRATELAPFFLQPANSGELNNVLAIFVGQYEEEQVKENLDPMVLDTSHWDFDISDVSSKEVGPLPRPNIDEGIQGRILRKFKSPGDAHNLKYLSYGMDDPDAAKAAVDLMQEEGILTLSSSDGRYRLVDRGAQKPESLSERWNRQPEPKAARTTFFRRVASGTEIEQALLQ